MKNDNEEKMETAPPEPVMTLAEMIKCCDDWMSETGDKSWAELTEEDDSLLSDYSGHHSAVEADAEEEEHEVIDGREGKNRRKTRLPRKASTRPKFEKTLETKQLNEEIFQKTERRRSQRLREQKKQQEINDDKGKPMKKRFRETTMTSGDEMMPRKRTQRDSSVKPTREIDSEGKLVIQMREGWVDPKNGWVQDEKILDRRSKELQKAKAKPVYHRYRMEIQKEERIKGVHPQTPNKLINYSRRSWDQMVRIWKRSLYKWGGEDPTESCLSDGGSLSGDSEAEDTTVMMVADRKEAKNEKKKERTLADLNNSSFEIRPDPDAMASLLNHFALDMNTSAGESTLKAPSNRNSLGPTDFSSCKKI